MPALALAAACLALAGVSLLAPSIPSYDPFAWIVWGRELVPHGQAFSVAGGPSWKPLPVLFTSVFALAGAPAPALWLLVARTGALLALAGAGALAARLAGRWAALVAAAGVLLTLDFAEFAWRGASEPLLLACVLWALERHLAGHRATAFALGVAAALIRPEAWPFLGLYAVMRWRETTPRERPLIAGGLLLVPLLWIGVPALAGDPLAAGSHAANYNGHTGSNPAWTALRRGVGESIAVVWGLALLAVWLRRRDPLVRALALGAVGWLVLVVAMTVTGFPGLGRFMLPAAAVACVLAGVAVGELLGHAAAARGARAGLALLLVACVALSVPRAASLGPQMRLATRAGDVQHQLTRAIDALGGRAAVLRCATGGAIATNHTAQTALAWKLRVGLDRVAGQMRRHGLLFRAPKLPAVGVPPPLRLRGPHRIVVLARAGVWEVAAVTRARARVPAACRAGAAPVR